MYRTNNITGRLCLVKYGRSFVVEYFTYQLQKSHVSTKSLNKPWPFLTNNQRFLSHTSCANMAYVNSCQEWFGKDCSQEEDLVHNVRFSGCFKFLIVCFEWTLNVVSDDKILVLPGNNQSIGNNMYSPNGWQLVAGGCLLEICFAMVIHSLYGRHRLVSFTLPSAHWEVFKLWGLWCKLETETIKNKSLHLFKCLNISLYFEG